MKKPQKYKCIIIDHDRADDEPCADTVTMDATWSLEDIFPSEDFMRIEQEPTCWDGVMRIQVSAWEDADYERAMSFCKCYCDCSVITQKHRWDEHEGDGDADTSDHCETAHLEYVYPPENAMRKTCFITYDEIERVYRKWNLRQRVSVLNGLRAKEKLREIHDVEPRLLTRVFELAWPEPEAISDLYDLP